MKDKGHRCRVVLPKCSKTYSKACHDDLSGGHLGQLKPLKKMAQRFFGQV